MQEGELAHGDGAKPRQDRAYEVPQKRWNGRGVMKGVVIYGGRECTLGTTLGVAVQPLPHPG